jgi:prevent-host-death family protein
LVEVGGGHEALSQIGASLDNSHLDSYLGRMASYSVADAKNHLPRLLNEALAGEEVTITRRGKAIARLVAEQPPAASIDLAWLDSVRVDPKDPDLDFTAIVRQMRDD